MIKPDKDIMSINLYILNKILANKNISKSSNLTKNNTSRSSDQECKVGLPLKKISNVNHGISRIENHMMSSIDAHKTVDKIQNLFTVKTFIRVFRARKRHAQIGAVQSRRLFMKQSSFLVLEQGATV